MTRLPRRLALAAVAALALAPPVAAQDNPGTFTLPPPAATPAPAPAGPADERAGVAIPPRAVPTPRITPAPVLTGEPQAPSGPRTAPSAAPTRTATPARTAAPAAGTVPAPAPTTAPAPLATASADPFALPTGAPTGAPTVAPADAPLALPTLPAPDAAAGSATDTILALPAWQLAAGGGGLAALVLLGLGLILRRRRKPKVLRLAAAPVTAEESAAAPDLADLQLALVITGATRSLMMFTLRYRLDIANRSGRAVNDLRTAAQVVCARASAGAPSVGAAQALAAIERIGPHQARSITGEVQLPLSAIQPLRQGITPLFVPLVHVTLEAEGQSAVVRSFVVGTPSPSGRIHPIPLNQPAGGIEGLVAQAVAIPAATAAA